MSVLRLLIAMMLVWPVVAIGQGVSLLGGEFGQRDPIIQIGQRSADGGQASLFIGRDGTSFFRPFPVRVVARTGTVKLAVTQDAVAHIRQIIAAAEAGSAGYNAVQHGARKRPERLPTAMTIGQIYAWIDATPGQPHAIGRYQFIPATLRRLVTKLGISPQTPFSPQTQDRLADVLLVEAGLNAMQAGSIKRHTFMRNLAKIWAGLPTPSGKSHYDGYAGNKATMSWARFDKEMARAFPG